MKFELDLPSAAAGVLVGAVLSSTPFAARLTDRWLLDYEGMPIAPVAAVVVFLGIAAALLLRSSARAETTTFRVESFTPTARSATAMPADVDVGLPAMRPLEWMQVRRCAHAGWKEASRQAFAAELAPSPSVVERQDAIVRAVAAAVRDGQYRPEAPLREVERLATLAWGGLRSGAAPDFAAYADAVEAGFPDELDLGGPGLRHAFPVTRLLHAVTRGRARGHLIPASHFLWLKGYDRALYYAVNNLNRHTRFIEGAGALAHFAAEVKAGEAMETPEVSDAVERLERYLRKHGLAARLEGGDETRVPA